MRLGVECCVRVTAQEWAAFQLDHGFREGLAAALTPPGAAVTANPVIIIASSTETDTGTVGDWLEHPPPFPFLSDSL